MKEIFGRLKSEKDRVTKQAGTGQLDPCLDGVEPCGRKCHAEAGTRLDEGMWFAETSRKALTGTSQSRSTYLLNSMNSPVQKQLGSLLLRDVLELGIRHKPYAIYSTRDT